ncbi:hypothetical protein Tco_1060572 [Tanacetum coccineum]
MRINPTVNLFRVFQIVCKQGDWFSFAKHRDDFLTDGYDHNDVLQLCARLAKLRDVDEAVLVRSGLNSVWLNWKCDPVLRKKDDNSVMSIYDFMIISSWDDAKVVKEPHGFADSILKRGFFFVHVI